MGMFYRTIRMLDSGIKPVYVFDGKPPQLKSGEVINSTEVLRVSTSAAVPRDDPNLQCTERETYFSLLPTPVCQEHYGRR